jgi:arylsulfatase
VVLLGLVSCRRDASERDGAGRRERVLDLLVRSDEAEVRGPDGRRRPIQLGDLPRNTDDDAVEVVVSAAVELRFADVPIHAGARLHCAVGVSKLDAEGPLSPVACRVAFEETSGTTELFTATIEHAQDRQHASGDVDLAKLVGRRGTVSVKMQGRPEAIVAWTRLAIESQGRPETAEDRTILVQEDAVDLSAVASASDGKGSLRMAAPGQLDLVVKVPPRPRLKFVAGAVPSAGKSDAPPLPRNAGLRLKVRVDGEEIASRMDLAADFASEPFRYREDLDLARFAGKTVRLRFEAEPCGGAPDRALDACIALPHLLSARPVERARRVRGSPDVFLFVVDTLRADALGCYGGPGNPTPNLDAFARTALVYERAHSQSSWTLPSTASILTGLHPDQHGARDGYSAYLLDSNETIAEALASRGFTTGGFSANAILSPTANFDQGFETYQCLPWPNARKLSRRVLDWLDGHESDRVFVWAQFVDPHSPYDAPCEPSRPGEPQASALARADFGELRDRATRDLAQPSPANDAELKQVAARAHELYLDEVRYFDRCFGRFLDELRARGRLDDAIIVVTSDHGEEFLEHGSLSHGNHLYEETVHVPLIVHAPGLTPGRTDAPVTGRDVKPLLLDLLGLGGAGAADELARLPRSEEAHLVTDIALEPGHEGTVRREALLKGSLKLIETPAVGRSELYDVAHDPRELEDVSKRVPRVSGALAELLEQWRQECSRTPRVSWIPACEDVLAEMRAMGYLK